jgi:hypothetical protein
LKYEGKFKYGRINGQGKITYPDGTTYLGEVKINLPNGQGKLTTPDGITYVGEFKDGLPNGHATYSLSDGSRFVGEFKDGEKWNGTLYDTEANISGKWVNGRLKWGVLFERKGNGVYDNLHNHP